MERSTSENDSDKPRVARLRPCWRLTIELKEGMVLAKPVVASSGGYATMSLGAGGVLTEETIAQLMVKGIECVAVTNTDPPSEVEYTKDRKRTRLNSSH